MAVSEALTLHCAATHAAIKAGRTNLKPIGVQRDDNDPNDVPLELYNCPLCGSTISRPILSKKDRHD